MPDPLYQHLKDIATTLDDLNKRVKSLEAIVRRHGVASGYSLVDGVTAPAAVVGVAIIYVDVADGDLKVIFGDGTIKTLATDT